MKLKRFIPVLLVCLALVTTALLFFIGEDENVKDERAKMEKFERKYLPADWFHYQRAYPNNDIPYEKYFDAIKEKEVMMGDNPSGGLTWQASGPFNVGGRITGLTVDPGNTNIMIVGAAAGGIFKTTDGGVTWDSKTDFEPSLSIGAVRMHPTNPNIIYCGTGEANTSTDSYSGFGMIKSTDKGDTWTLSGLSDSRTIGEIAVTPQNPDLVYTAVTGGLYSKGENRGIYKSPDGGANWERVFFLNDSTSAIDVAIDPSDTNRIYAAMFERLRGPNFRKAGGVASGVYMSTDAGQTWNRLTNGLPAPAGDIGRICIAVAPSNPNYVYALYRKVGNPGNLSQNNVFEGFYRSTDKGVSWTRMPDGILDGEFSSFGWYFGLIEVDPTDFNKVYIGDIDIFRSTNGGTSWSNVTEAYSGTFDEQHPDQHALWINPSNINNMVNGNDGGIFTTVNNGSNWTKSYDLPISQFYASTIDYQLPQRKYGGTQDNGTWGTKTGGTDDWEFFYGGDGFVTLVDYTNSDIIYAESQFGRIGRSTDGGNDFDYIGGGIDFDRTNWNTPYIMDIQEPSTLFIGTFKVFKTTNRGNNWSAISPDLTRGPNGRQGTITCLSSAVLTGGERIIYAGTDDAKLSVTTNSGGVWTDVTGSLPDRYMTDVIVDYRNPEIAYVTLSGYNLDLKSPHVFRTTDYGASWISIDGNLPDIPVNSIEIDYNRGAVLYIGTDAGAFYTDDLGATWQVLGTGLPNSPIFDLNFHAPSQTVAAGTHGRSIFEIDVTNLPVSIKNISSIAEDYNLKQNYPNPFNPTTQIEFSIPRSGKVNLTVYDLTGKMVSVLVNENKNPGRYSVEFSGAGLSSGVYFYRINAEGFSDTKRMILVK